MKRWGMWLVVAAYTAHWLDVCMPSTGIGVPQVTVERIGESCTYSRPGQESFDDKWEATKFLANCPDCDTHALEDETSICCDHKTLKNDNP